MYSWQPIRPAYLSSNLMNLPVNHNVILWSTNLNQNIINWTIWDSTHNATTAIVTWPMTAGNLTIGDVYEINYMTAGDPMHFHIYPVQIVSSSCPQYIVGEYYDNILIGNNIQCGSAAAPFKARLRPLDYGGKDILRCQNLVHADMGQMTYFNVNPFEGILPSSTTSTISLYPPIAEEDQSLFQSTVYDNLDNTTPDNQLGGMMALRFVSNFTHSNGVFTVNFGRAQKQCVDYCLYFGPPFSTPRNITSWFQTTATATTVSVGFHIYGFKETQGNITIFINDMIMIDVTKHIAAKYDRSKAQQWVELDFQGSFAAGLYHFVLSAGPMVKVYISDLLITISSL